MIESDIIVIIQRKQGVDRTIKLNRAHIMYVRYDDYGNHIHLSDGSVITTTTCPYTARSLVR